MVVVRDTNRGAAQKAWTLQNRCQKSRIPDKIFRGQETLLEFQTGWPQSFSSNLRSTMLNCGKIADLSRFFHERQQSSTLATSRPRAVMELHPGVPSFRSRACCSEEDWLGKCFHGINKQVPAVGIVGELHRLESRSSESPGPRVGIGLDELEWSSVTLNRKSYVGSMQCGSVC